MIHKILDYLLGGTSQVEDKAALRTHLGVNAAPVSTVTSVEAVGLVNKTTLTLAALAIAVSDANVGGGSKIYDFPEGRILVLGVVGSVAFTTTSVLAGTLNTGVTLSWGIGTVQTTSQGSGTLATTQQNLLPATAATASATVNVAGATANGALATSAQFDGTAAAVAAYLNVGVVTATDIDADATITASGTVTIHWIKLGDY